jgi:hypothetical protein
MPKKLKLNIECIIVGSKIKKRHRRNSVGLPNKLIRLPKAKQTKGKRYYKEG